jgi:hypothetical protein
VSASNFCLRSIIFILTLTIFRAGITLVLDFGKSSDFQMCRRLYADTTLYIKQ